MKLLITLWEWSAIAFVGLLAWLLWSDRKWQKARQPQPPAPQDTLIYRRNGKRIA